jgi:hypothetical protein
MLLRTIAAVSGIYDVCLGLGLLLGRPLLMSWFGLPAPAPPIHADLNGLFTLAIGVGYLLPWRDPQRYRGYFWIMGAALKGLGAAWFVGDVVLRGSPASYLLFALCDGSLAVATTLAMVATRKSHKEGTSGISSVPRDS